MRKYCTTGLPTAQRGMSLMELMVAVAVGLVLVAGLATLFGNSSQAGNELDKSLRQMENGRYAVELLAEDLSVAGFYGELPGSGINYGPASTCATALAATGWDAAANTAPQPVTGLSAAEAAALTCLTNHRAGTPALVVRRLETEPTAAASVPVGQIHAQASRCKTDASTPAFIVSDAAADFSLRDQACAAVNTVRRYVARIYYVAACDECGSDTIPTLKKAELRGNAWVISPLAEGVEEVAFEYGFDLAGGGEPGVYRSALSGVAGDRDNDWGNVVAIRMYVLSRATEASLSYTDPKTYVLGLAGSRGPFTDHFKRRVYSSTSRLLNVAGPREPS